jgi:hypothetical protein
MHQCHSSSRSSGMCGASKKLGKQLQQTPTTTSSRRRTKEKRCQGTTGSLSHLGKGQCQHGE